MTKYGISEAKSSIGFKSYAVPNRALGESKTLRGLLLRGAVFVSAFSMVFSAFVPMSVEVAKAASVSPVIAEVPDPKPNDPDRLNPNPTCADLDGIYAENGTIWSEAKVDSNALGNGVKNFAGISVTISNYTSNSFDFTSTVGVDAVLVKAGSENHNLYIYQPGPGESTGDTNLVTSGQQGISHITFCFDVEEETTELTLIKQLAGDETEDEVSDWLLEADGGETVGPAITGDPKVTDKEITPGEYILSEDGPEEGYTASDWVCTKETDSVPVQLEVTNGNTVDIEEGDDVTCVITNTYTEEDPEIPNLHFIKVVCEEYSDVEGNNSADQRDDTGGKYTQFWNSPNWGTVSKPVNPDEIPENCERADGWEFKLSTGVANDYQDQVDNIQIVGPTVNGEYVTDAYGENSDLNEALQAGIQNGAFWVSEVEQPGYGFAAIRCYNDALNGDNLEFINIGQNFQGSDIYCIAYNVDTEVEIPCEEGPGWATEVVSNTQGKRKDGSNVLAGRSDPNLATGPEDWVSGTGSNFYSLGFGGDITLSFAGYVTDEPGDDLSIHEATNGSYPNETVKIEVSKDGSNWFTLSEQGTNTSPGGVTYVDFNETGLNWIKFVKLTDTSNPALFPNDADGFDLDAVDATNQDCEPPVVEEECEEIILDFTDKIKAFVSRNEVEGVQCSISGYKYRDSDDSGTISPGDELLEGWEIYLDNDGNCFYDDESPTTTTDSNGYYEFDNLDSGTYYVCERQQNDWTQVLPDNGEESANRWAHEIILTDESAQNVDFLNKEDSREECEEVKQEEDFISRAFAYLSEAVVIEDSHCAISGTKYEDENGNGEIDKDQEGYNDPTVEGVTIFLAETDECAYYEDMDLQTTTDSNGYYEFTNLPAGTYYVCELVEDGWTQVLPNNPSYYTVVMDHESHYNKDFLNALPEPCKEPVILNLVSGNETQTAGSTNVNPSATPLSASSYEGSFGSAAAATTVIPPWVDPTTGSFTGSGAIWVSTSTDHPGAGDEGSSTEDQWRLFRHEFTIPDADSIEQATLYYTADNAVTVYLNGVEISSTPVSTFGFNAFPVDANYDDTYSVNFTPIEGENTISFVVRNSGGEYGPSNPTGLLYATSVEYTPACEPDDGGGDSSSTSSSSGSRSSDDDDEGRVLGDSTGLPYQAPQVLGETTELPRTGTPLAIAFSIVGILAIVLIPRYAKVSVK